MSINDIREQLTNNRNALTKAIADGVALANKAGVTFKELEDSNANVATLQAKQTALAAALADAEAAGKPKPPEAAPAAANGKKPVRSQRTGTNEYMHAWGKAMRFNLTPRRDCPSDDYKILYDALTEVGGTPEGSDGGFLVPEDVDHSIHELLRDFGSLRELVEVEQVTTIKGSRVRDNAPTKGLVALDAEGDEINDTDDQPSFVQVNYSTGKYGLIINVSRDLLKDNIANLAAYISRWFARKQVITENKLIIAKLNLLAASNFTPADDEDAIRKIRNLLNVALDPAISPRATIVTNQSGLDYLDSIVDGNGRPLLTQDPVSGAPMLLRTRPIRMFSDALLPNRVVSTVGATKGTYFPLYVGDGKQYMTLFEREGLEFASTDVGGDAFDKDITKFRGLTRLGGGVFDTAAMIRREIFIAG